MNHKAKVYILYTGGTIGMGPRDKDVPGSPLVPKPLKDIEEYVPGINDDGIFLGFGNFEKPLDSSNVGPSHWKDMAKIIEREYNNYDGFVILHGTDTLAYTASALSFMFENLAKPVVITGSQLPISHPRTDARQNLVNAVHIAGWRATELPLIPEVVVVFADKIVRGCRVRKVSSTAWAGFDSPNYPLLGHIGEHIRINERLLRRKPADGLSFQVNYDLSNDVIDFSLTPGMKSTQVEKILSLQKGIILRTFGAGNAMGDPGFLAAVDNAIRNDKRTILNITQCQEGMVEMGLYAASSALLERGVISGLDMTPEAALTKLMWTLGSKIGDQITSQLQVSQRGEQSENLFDVRFGKCGSESDAQTGFVQYRTPDRRFERENISRAVVRFSGLGVAGAKPGESVQIRVFMNLPSANASTGVDHPKFVADFTFQWDGISINEAREIEVTKAKSSIGDDDITLSVVAPEGLKIWFDGLFLALFAKAN